MFSAMSARESGSDLDTGSSVSAPPRLVIHSEGDPQRQEVEGFIRRIYADRYGADVQQFAPVLASLRDSSGIVAAAGYRNAAPGPLFLERYFDAPIESLLAAHAEPPPARDRIVEVGHLAASRAGEGLVLAHHARVEDGDADAGAVQAGVGRFAAVGAHA